jgi:hypothetical protein
MRNFQLSDRQTALLLASLRTEARAWFAVAENKARRRDGRLEMTPVARFALGIGHDFEALADDIEIAAAGGLQ